MLRVSPAVCTRGVCRSEHRVQTSLRANTKLDGGQCEAQRAAGRTRDGDVRVLQLLALLKATILPHILRQGHGHVKLVRVRVPVQGRGSRSPEAVMMTAFCPSEMLHCKLRLATAAEGPPLSCNASRLASSHPETNMRNRG